MAAGKVAITVCKELWRTAMSLTLADDLRLFTAALAACEWDTALLLGYFFMVKAIKTPWFECEKGLVDCVQVSLS